MNKFWILYFSFPILLFACTPKEKPVDENASLPIIKKLDKETKEMVEHTIRPFSFINQDSQEVTNATFLGERVYIADFFFIHCPTICPKVKRNMKNMYDYFEDNDEVAFLSHSIDTRHDTVPALKRYAEALGVETNKWHFVTGEKAEIYEIAEDYNSSALEDPTAPGGFDHSGYIILIDKKGHIRAFARGTDKDDTDRLIVDVEKLLKEYKDEG